MIAIFIQIIGDQTKINQPKFMQIHLFWFAWLFFFAIQLRNERLIANENVIWFQIVVDEAQLVHIFKDADKLQSYLQDGVDSEFVVE